MIDAAEKKKTSSKDPRRLRAAWERLMKAQQADGRKDASDIVSVEIAENAGTPSVIIKTVNGGVIEDSGEQKMLFRQLKRAEENSVSAIGSRLSDILAAIAEYGWDAAVAGLSAQEIAFVRKKLKESGLKPASKRSSSHSRQNQLVKNLTNQRDDARKKGLLPKNGQPDLLAKHIREKDRAFIRTEKTQLAIRQSHSSLLKRERDRYRSILTGLRLEYNEKQLSQWREQLYGSDNKAAVIDRKIKQNIPLSKEEASLNEKRGKYGIKPSTEKENLTPEQKKARAEMDSSLYSGDIAADFNKEVLRKKQIFMAKVQALKVVCETEAIRDMKGGKAVIDADEIRKRAYAKIPPKGDLTGTSLHEVNHRLKKERTESKSLRLAEERRFKERHSKKLVLHRQDRTDKKQEKAAQSSRPANPVRKIPYQSVGR